MKYFGPSQKRQMGVLLISFLSICFISRCFFLFLFRRRFHAFCTHYFFLFLFKKRSDNELTVMFDILAAVCFLGVPIHYHEDEGKNIQKKGKKIVITLKRHKALRRKNIVIQNIIFFSISSWFSFCSSPESNPSNSFQSKHLVKKKLYFFGVFRFSFLASTSQKAEQ